MSEEGGGSKYEEGGEGSIFDLPPLPVEGGEKMAPSAAAEGGGGGDHETWHDARDGEEGGADGGAEARGGSGEGPLPRVAANATAGAGAGPLPVPMPETVIPVKWLSRFVSSSWCPLPL